MAVLGISIRDVAQKVDVTYEQVRRIVNCGCKPSNTLLQLLCQLLDLDYPAMSKLMNEDIVEFKYGVTPAAPGPLAEIWDDLTPVQQEDLLLLAKSWVKRNREKIA
jgi:hypothetical protein